MTRGAAIAAFHGSILYLIYGTDKAVIYQVRGFVSKILIFGTTTRHENRRK